MQNIISQFPIDYTFNAETLTNVPSDVRPQHLADMLNNYYSDKLFHNHGISEDRNGASPTSGYMVSLAGTERKLPEYSLASRHQIETACREHHRTIQPNTYFGAWIDEDILYLDNSVNIEDLETATAFGHANKQIAIWDVVNRKTIYLNK